MPTQKIKVALASCLRTGAVLLALMGAGQATAHPVGMGPDDSRGFTQLVSTVPCIPPVCTVPTEAITADPGAPNWLKTFQLEIPVPLGGLLTIIENIVVGQPGNPGPNWTDWHEVLNPLQGWIWVAPPPLGAAKPTLSAIPLVGPAMLVPGEISADGLEIDFDGFDLPTGTSVFITKTLQCVTPDGGQACDLLEIREWPTTAAVPEPATLVLLALALAGITLSRRRVARARRRI